MNRVAIVLTLTLLALLSGSGWAPAGSDAVNRDDPAWTVMAGYGKTHPDLGDTRVDVETVDLVLRRDIPLTGRLGSSWYQGYHALLVELPVSIVTSPSTDPMVGLILLGSWYFTSPASWQPYVFAGGGIVYTDADIEGLGSRLNANWQLGAGLRFRLTGAHWLSLEYRFHHISNTGAADPNDPLNASKFLIGLTF